MNLFRQFGTAEGEERGSQVDAEDCLAELRLWLDERGIADEEGNADGFFVGEAALEIQAVFAVEVTVVAGENNQRAIELAGFLEGGENLADAFFGGHHQAEAIADGFVVGGGFAGEGRETVELSHEGWLVGG